MSSKLTFAETVAYDCAIQLSLPWAQGSGVGARIIQENVMKIMSVLPLMNVLITMVNALAQDAHCDKETLYDIVVELEKLHRMEPGYQIGLIDIIRTFTSDAYQIVGPLTKTIGE